MKLKQRLYFFSSSSHADHSYDHSTPCRVFNCPSSLSWHPFPLMIIRWCGKKLICLWFIASEISYLHILGLHKHSVGTFQVVMPHHLISIYLLFLKGFSALLICTLVPSRCRWWWWKEQWWQRSKVNVHFNSFTQATPIPLHSIQRLNCVLHFFQSCISFHSFYSHFFHYWAS